MPVSQSLPESVPLLQEKLLPMRARGLLAAAARQHNLGEAHSTARVMAMLTVMLALSVSVSVSVMVVVTSIRVRVMFTIMVIVV